MCSNRNIAQQGNINQVILDHWEMCSNRNLSESQKAQIRNALGRDASGTIFAKGYVLQIDPATAAIRSDRRSPTMTLYYADGGSVQRLNLASIAIQ